MFGTPVKTLHVELTSRCTLMCPRCPRTYDPASLSVQDLDLDTIKERFTRAAFPHVEIITLAGNFGDPIYHRRFHEVVRHLKAEGFKLHLNTNGSYRDGNWWRTTASLLTRRDSVTLSIDGLEESNSTYRVNSRWDDIMTAIATLRGRVWLTWKFIIFSHNQHQIGRASKRADKLGFDEFTIIRSDRFGGQWRDADGKDRMRPGDEWVSGRLARPPAGAEAQHARG